VRTLERTINLRRIFFSGTGGASSTTGYTVGDAIAQVGMFDGADSGGSKACVPLIL
jgi:hypothetical protein